MGCRNGLMGQFYQISSINEWINTSWMELLTEWMSNHKQIVWVSINGVGCRSLKTFVKCSELVNSPILFTFLKSFSKLSTPKAHHRHPRTENPHKTIHQPFFQTVFSTIIDTQTRIIDTLGDDLLRNPLFICECKSQILLEQVSGVDSKIQTTPIIRRIAHNISAIMRNI